MANLDDHKIGIALSGGGARAIAFHLGCLRTLHRTGVLAKAKVISSVSGGSVIAGLYAVHDGPFEAFEARVRALLAQGLVRSAVRTTLTTPEGLKAVGTFLLLAGADLAVWVAKRVGLAGGHASPKLRRTASRTTILRRTLDQRVFAGARMSATERPDRPKWIAIATELRTGSAFYFRAGMAGSWRFGRMTDPDVSVAQAVVASAAFPLLLPALDEVLAFEKAGVVYEERISLSDGGIYDNLGLQPLWPDRDARFSLEVEDVDTLIACRAGDGLRLGAPPRFLLSRMWATFAATHDRAQNATMKRLFDLEQSGGLKRILIPYLGQDDSRLKFAPADLTPRAEVINYPADFSPMTAAWIERLVRRGEQVALAVIREHAPDWLPAEADTPA